MAACEPEKKGRLRVLLFFLLIATKIFNALSLIQLCVYCASFFVQ